MHVLYVPVNERVWLAQLQAGRGLGTYTGERYQRGYGLGAIFGSLLRSIMPIVKNVGRAVGKQALRTGASVAQDVLDGTDIQESLKTRGKQGARRLVRKAVRRQRGRGVGFRPRGPTKTIKAITKRKKRVIRKKRTGRKRKTKKKSHDTFGLY